MKKKTIYLLFFIHFSYGVLAQKKELEKELLEYTKEDTVKVNMLNKLAYEYLKSKPLKVLALSKESLLLSQELKYNKGIAKSNLNIGFTYLNQGYYKNALQYLNASFQTNQKTNNKRGLAQVLLYKGMIFYNFKDFKKALNLYNQALEIFIELKLKELIGYTHNQIGNVLMNQKGKSKEAIEHLTIAFEEYREIKVKSPELRYSLANYYIKENNLIRAHHHITKSIEITKKSYLLSQTKNVLLLGKILILQGELDEAEINLLKGLQYAKDSHFIRQELFAYNELRKLKQATNQPEVAIAYYDKYNELNKLFFSYKTLKDALVVDKKTSIDTRIHTKNKVKLEYSFYLLPLLTIYLITLIVCRKKIKKRLCFQETKYEQKEEEFKDLLEEIEMLKAKLELKNKEFSSFYFKFQKKDDLIKNICEEALFLEKNLSIDEVKKNIKKIIKLAKENSFFDKEWGRYKTFFEESQSGFYAKLKLKHEDLKTNDLRLCSLIKLNLNIKETANILNISTGSLKTARYRLRKKMNLENGQDLLGYLVRIESEIIDNKRYSM